MPLVNKNIDITNCMNILIVAYLIRRLHKVISYFRFSFIEMPSQIRAIDKEVIKRHQSNNLRLRNQNASSHIRSK